MNHLAVKELPLCERPYEKMWTFGESSLSDVDLIAIILRSGSKEKNSMELAREVLRLSDGSYSLLALHKKPVEELQKIPGIGKVKASILKCIAEISVRISDTGLQYGLLADTPKVIVNHYMERLRHLNYEQLIAVYLNGGSYVIGDKVISTGAVNQSIVPPREIFLNALKKEAVYIILIHNHPSGNSSPSKEDISITENLCKAGELLGIKILDHLIIGDRKYFSFREHQIM